MVRLGDANPEAYECAMDLLKTAIYKLTPIADVRDGMGLEDRIQQTKKKEVPPAIAQASACASDAEGSAIGNFVGLKAPERKRKAGRPTNSRDKPPYDDRGAKSKKFKQRATAQDADKCGTSKRLVSVVYAENQVTRARHAHKEEIFPQKKGRGKMLKLWRRWA